MKINEREAWIVIGSIDTTAFEQGDVDLETKTLYDRIRAEFPAIDKKIKDRERKDHIWRIEAENDPRVKSARQKIQDTPMFDCCGLNPEYEKVQKEFFRVKSLVNKEICTKEGLR